MKHISYSELKIWAECPFKHEFKCMGCTESGRKREIGEGKEYSNSAFQMAYDHGEYCIKHSPGGRIKIHNSGGFKHNGKFTTSIVTEYPHGPNKKFLLGNYTKEEWKSNNMVYFKNDKKVCLLAKDVDVPFNQENPEPKILIQTQNFHPKPKFSPKPKISSQTQNFRLNINF